MKFFRVRVQVLEVGPKVDRRLFTPLCLQFFFFRYQHETYTHQTWSSPWSFHLRHIFVFKEVFLIHNNLVTQKISHFEIIYQSPKRCAFFYIRGWICVSFLKYSIDFFLVQTSFSSKLRENDCNLIVAKMFLAYTIIAEKTLWRLTFQSVVFLFCTFLDLFWQNKILFRSFKKLEYVLWTLLPVPGEKYWQYKEIFPCISFWRLLCFSFNNIAFKKFICVKWSFEASFWKKVAKKNVNKYRKIIR